MTEKINTGGNISFVYPKDYKGSELSEEEKKEIRDLQDKAKADYLAKKEKDAYDESERLKRWRRRTKFYAFMDAIRPYVIGAIVILALLIISGKGWWPTIWEFITSKF